MAQPKTYIETPKIKAHMPHVNHAFAVVIGPDVEDTIFLAEVLKRLMPYYSEPGDRVGMVYAPAQLGVDWIAGAMGEQVPRGTKMVCSMCSQSFWTTARADPDHFYLDCNVIGCAGDLVVQ